jgi:hypothetical protein
MSTITSTLATDPVAAGPAVLAADRRSRARLLRTGVTSGLVASAAAVATVVVARTAGEDVAIAGERVPLSGFVVLTMVGALLGTVIAKVLSRRSSRPRSMFVTTTVALTAASIVPDLVVEAQAGSRLVLACTHVVAAAIIVPALAGRMRRAA